ncbi:MAG: cobalt ECF transporter T component CbiQ [Chloroflexi bacterium]|nr:cobalt ECF transporter T component CbiQ [Chloroflexota bacterium]
MTPTALDRYLARSSVIHRLDPRVKVTLTVLFVVSNVVVPDGAWPAFALAWAILVAGNLLGSLGPWFTLRRSFVALPFALVAVTAMFAVPGQPLFTLTLGSTQLVATDAGLVRVVSIALRTWLSVQVAILLTATTRFPDLMHALRHLRLPALLVAIVAFMYRYLFVLTDETQRLLRARDARSARLPGVTGGGSWRWRARVAGSMAGQLFLRSYERSDRVYQAMLARGYRGELLSLNPHRLRRSDLLFLFSGGVALILIQIVGRVRLG